MELISIGAISVRPDRQRRDFDKDRMLDLETSIRERGLINPIFIEHVSDEYQFQLVAGERRLKACGRLHELQVPFFFAGILVPPGSIPCTVVGTLSALQHVEIEFDENAMRQDLSWQESTAARARIVELRMALDATTTMKEVATDIAAKTGNAVSGTQVALSRALTIQNYIEVPSVAGARSEKEAYRNATRYQQSRFEAELARRRSKHAVSSGRELVELRRGDLFDILPTLDSDSVDSLITDPPYGYGGQSWFPQKTAVKHLYRDDLEYAQSIYRFLLSEGFRICKPKSTMVMFCQPSMFGWLLDESKRQLWTPFPSPLIWNKGPGYAPWGNLGFRRNYEMLFFASKGQRGLTKLRDDIFNYPRTVNKEHAAQKPIALMEDLIDHLTIPGDFVLDPCMGAGSTILAARRKSRRALGLELVSDYFNLAMGNLAKEKDGKYDEEAPDDGDPLDLDGVF